MSLAMEQDSSSTQDKMASRKNFRSMSNLIEANGIPKSIKEDSSRSTSALASSSVVQFPKMLLCPESRTSETLDYLQTFQFVKKVHGALLLLFYGQFNQLTEASILAIVTKFHTKLALFDIKPPTHLRRV